MGTMAIVVAGFGGQGALFAGLVLAHAAMRSGNEVAWIPSYGPEVRGGTAGCAVIVSDEQIGSPIVSHPSAAVALNEPSLVKWMPRVIVGGVLVINRSMATSPLNRADLKVVEIAITEEARALGDERVGNILALGALLHVLPVVPMAAVEAAVAETLGHERQALVTPNVEALRLGSALAQSNRSSTPQAAA